MIKQSYFMKISMRNMQFSQIFGIIFKVMNKIINKYLIIISELY